METLLLKIITGGILGLCGQGIRVIVGMKGLNDKVNDVLSDYDTLDKKSVFKEMYSGQRVVLSLFFGFVTGVLAILTLDNADEQLSQAASKGINGDGNDPILGIIVAGYAGTDLIEKFFGKYLS